MKKVLAFLKQNIAFFIILALALVFYFIAIFGGDYQTTIYHGITVHYTFVNGISGGVPLAFAYVIVPAVCLLGIFVLNFFKPKKRDGKIAVLFVSFFIAFAFIAGLMIGLSPFGLFNGSSPNYYQLGDWTNTATEVYFVKTYSFPYLSMVISLAFTIILGCYASATLSE